MSTTQVDPPPPKSATRTFTPIEDKKDAICNAIEMIHQNLLSSTAEHVQTKGFSKLCAFTDPTRALDETVITTQI